MITFSTIHKLSFKKNKLYLTTLRLSIRDKYIGFTINKNVLHIGLGNTQISLWRE